MSYSRKEEPALCSALQPEYPYQCTLSDPPAPSALQHTHRKRQRETDISERYRKDITDSFIYIYITNRCLLQINNIRMHTIIKKSAVWGDIQILDTELKFFFSKKVWSISSGIVITGQDSHSTFNRCERRPQVVQMVEEDLVCSRVNGGGHAGDLAVWFAAHALRGMRLLKQLQWNADTPTLA